MNIDDAARSLYDQLKTNPRLVTIGTDKISDFYTIHVYVSSTNVEVPASWEGFSVVCNVVSEVVPAVT